MEIINPLSITIGNTNSDISIEELIDQANNGEIPPPFGEMEITVLGSPASIQAKREVKEQYISSIKNQFNRFQYILTGEIIMNITWFISAKSRYETDASADIDNCIKPIIDAFAGAEGLFIDDCQLKGLYICWKHSASDVEQLSFQLGFHPNDFSKKDGLAFVRLGNGLCTPVNLNWPKEARQVLANILKSGQNYKDALENLGIDYYYVAGFLGNSRPFHVTRIHGFRVMSIEQFTT